jgi:hypothetical protein
MAGDNYQISTNALKHIIDSTKKLEWAGFVPVSQELKQKIDDTRDIIMGAVNRAYDIEEKIRQMLEAANKRYTRKVAGLLRQGTGIPAKVFEEFVHWPWSHTLPFTKSDISEFEGALRNANEIKLEPGYFVRKLAPKLVHCPRLEARTITSCKGRWYNVKIVDASQNEQGFAVTLYTPAPKFSKNYKMLRQCAALENLVKQAAK